MNRDNFCSLRSIPGGKNLEFDNYNLDNMCQKILQREYFMVLEFYFIQAKYLFHLEVLGRIAQKKRVFLNSIMKHNGF